MDFDSLTREIGTLTARILQTDLSALRGYSAAKARAIAGYTLMLGEARARGELDDAGMAAEREELDRMVLRFVRNIEALAATTVERLASGLIALLNRAMLGVLGPVEPLLPPGTEG